MKPIDIQELLNMKLHEKKSLSSSLTGQTKEWILRVHGGWIYYRQQFYAHQKRPDTIFETATFVPER